jgi:outer membrane protein OmpA-like peptidoglycan-associated protein
VRARLRWRGRHRCPGVSWLMASAVVAALVAGGCAADPLAPPTTDDGREIDATHRQVLSPPTVVGDVPRVGLMPGTPPRVADPTATTSPQTTSGSLTSCRSYTLTHMNFETNSAGLTGAAASYVARLAATLIACDCPFSLHGFADPRPTSYPGGNQQLSFDRASTVRTELIARGVPQELFVDVLGRGTEDPMPGDLAASRRVEVVLGCPSR